MARSLIEHGAGTMMPVRDRLHTLPMPVLAITGALDRTYTELWAGIVSEAPNIRHVIVPNAGHRVHLDNPSAYLSTVLSFIQEHIPS
jgi:pimeloyl-ACP methyl ester carboxylesterase